MLVESLGIGVFMTALLAGVGTAAVVIGLTMTVAGCGGIYVTGDRLRSSGKGPLRRRRSVSGK